MAHLIALPECGYQVDPECLQVDDLLTYALSLAVIILKSSSVCCSLWRTCRNIFHADGRQFVYTERQSSSVHDALMLHRA